MSGSHADAYHKMKLEQQIKGYKTLANSMNALGNRGIPPQDLYTSLITGTSIPQTSSIKLTPKEIEERELDRHLKEYLEIQAEYNRRQEAEAAAAAAKAEAAAAGPKSPKSPSKGSKGGSKRNRRNNRNRTYRGRPTRSRSSRRNA